MCSIILSSASRVFFFWNLFSRACLLLCLLAGCLSVYLSIYLSVSLYTLQCSTYIHILYTLQYMYVCMCVCVCVFVYSIHPSVLLRTLVRLIGCAYCDADCDAMTVMLPFLKNLLHNHSVIYIIIIFFFRRSKR